MSTTLFYELVGRTDISLGDIAERVKQNESNKGEMITRRRWRRRGAADSTLPIPSLFSR